MSRATEAYEMEHGSSAAGAGVATDAPPAAAATATAEGRAAAPVTGVLLSLVDRFRWWLLAWAVLLYLGGFSGVYHPEPDSALYLTIGRNIAEGQGFTYQGQTNHLAYPGYPYLLAGVFEAFGTGDGFFWPHVLMLVLTGLTLGATYVLFRLVTDRPMAVLVTFNCAIAVNLYGHTFQVRNDVPFLLGVMAFLAGHEALARRGRGVRTAPVWGLSNPVAPWVLMCAGLLVAVVMRPAMWALVGAFVLGTVWSLAGGAVRKRHVLAALTVVGMVLAFYLIDPRGAEMDAGGGGQYEQTASDLIQSPGEVLRRALHPWTFVTLTRDAAESMFGHEFWRGFNVLVMGPFLVAALVLFYRRPVWFLYLALTLAMLMAMAQMERPNEPTVTGQLVPRHFLGVLPLMLYAWWLVVLRVEGRLPRTKWVVPVILLLWGVPFIGNYAKLFETMYRQRAYAALTAAGGSETNSLEEIGAAIRRHVGDRGTVVVPLKQARLMTLYGRCRAVDANRRLTVGALEGPVYVLDQASPSIHQFLRRENLALGPKLAEVPGRVEWRGRPVHPWTLHEVRAGAGVTGAAGTQPVTSAE